MNAAETEPQDHAPGALGFSGVDHQAPGLNQRLWSVLSSLAGNHSLFLGELCDN